MSGFLEREPERMPLGRLIALTGHRLSEHWQQAVADHTDLSRTALMALTAIEAEGRLTHREVAKHCWVRPPTLTPVVDALEANGLLSRQRDTTDRRVVRLRITATGQDALREAWRGIGAQFEGIIPQRQPEEEAAIRNYLLEVLRGLDGKEGRRDARC
jgi:DNA-binding MarR family transcriptional regulator